LQQNIWDQIIEGLSDGDTLEDLLQESNLSIAATITKYQSREATKKNCLSDSQPRYCRGCCSTPQVLATHTADQTANMPRLWRSTPQGGATTNTQHTIKPAFCYKVGHFARVCRSKLTRQTNASGTIPQVSVNAILVQPQQGYYIQLGGDKAESAPTVIVYISSSKGTKAVKVLPDLR